MQIRPFVSNAVFVGNFRPSQLDKYFFVKNGIFQEQEFASGSQFNGELQTIVETEKASVVVTQGRILIDAINPMDIDLISKISQSTLQNLDVITTAMGFNFHWLLTSDDVDFIELSKKLFKPTNNDFVSKNFDTDDAAFGMYMSRNVGRARLKLEIKPMTYETPKTEAIEFRFNYHFEMANSEPKVLIEEVSSYETYAKNSEEMMLTYLS